MVQVQGLSLDPVSVSEVDLAIYDTAPGNPNKRGVRISIRGRVEMKLCFSVERSDAIDPFATGRHVTWRVAYTSLGFPKNNTL